MPKKYDRVTTGTRRVVEYMTGTSPAYNGLFKKLKVDGRNKTNGNKLITIDYQFYFVGGKNSRDNLVSKSFLQIKLNEKV